MLPREWRLCTQCVRASTESNDQGNSIFVKRLETFVLSAIYKLNIIIIKDKAHAYRQTQSFQSGSPSYNKVGWSSSKGMVPGPIIM